MKMDSGRHRHEYGHGYGSKGLDLEFEDSAAMVEIQQIFNEIRESECRVMRFEDEKRQQHYRERGHVESA